MSKVLVPVAFSATEAFHKKADEYARRLGMTRATFIATVVEFALKDKRFFMDAFTERTMRELSVALHGEELYSVGERTKSVQLNLTQNIIDELDGYAKRMGRSRSDVLATLAEEGFEAQRLPIALASKKWFRDFVKFLETRGAFTDVLPQPK